MILHLISIGVDSAYWTCSAWRVFRWLPRNQILRMSGNQRLLRCAWGSDHWTQEADLAKDCALERKRWAALSRERHVVELRAGAAELIALRPYAYSDDLQDWGIIDIHIATVVTKYLRPCSRSSPRIRADPASAPAQSSGFSSATWPMSRLCDLIELQPLSQAAGAYPSALQGARAIPGVPTWPALPPVRFVASIEYEEWAAQPRARAALL